MRRGLLVVIFSTLSLSVFNFARAGIEPRGPAVPAAVTAPVKEEKLTPAPPVILKTKQAQPRGETNQTPMPESNKLILVSLKDQDLKYFEGTTLKGEFKISSGLRGTPTPPGEYTVLQKKPVVDYKGLNYDFPNTKWNLLFKKGSPLSYYIHGAYWHNNFGNPMSHGCVNVAYGNMEPLYNWADVGTKILIE